MSKERKPVKYLKEIDREIKNGKIDEIYEKLKLNNKIDEFSEKIFMDLFGEEEIEGESKYDNLMMLYQKIVYDKLLGVYGEKISDRLLNEITKEKNLNVRCRVLTLYYNGIRQKNQISTEQSKDMEELMDVIFNEDNVVGTHITGRNIGEKILKEGILLTGHKLLAKDDSDYSDDLTRRLEKNVTFFNYQMQSRASLLSHIINSRGYNASQGNFNDVMIVSIPKNDLENNSEEIIKNGEYLNPKYLAGYVSVGVKNGEIAQFQKNPEYQESRDKECISEFSVEDWNCKFSSWYEETKIPKFQKIKNSIINRIKNLLKKKAHEERDDEVR